MRTSVADAFDGAVAMEVAVRDIYLSFSETFRAPGAGDFFRAVANDEDGHVLMWNEIRDALPAATLRVEASELLSRSLEDARTLLARKPQSRIETLWDACELARQMESAELLAVFRAMAMEAVPNAKRRRFLEHQIEQHIEQIDELSGWMGWTRRAEDLPAVRYG